MLTLPNVLLVTADDAESSTIAKLLDEHVILRCARTPLELHRFLGDGGFDAILYGQSFETGPGSSTLQLIRHRFPDLPVIVLGRTGSEKEWAEVLEAGAIDLVASPFGGGSLLPVLENAITCFNARLWYNEMLDRANAK